MLAAVIAYAAAGRAAKEARIGVRQEQWWDRARWALDLTLSDEEVNRTAGLEALGALGKSSQWTDEHETEFIEAVVNGTLERWLYQQDAGMSPPFWWTIGARRWRK